MLNEGYGVTVRPCVHCAAIVLEAIHTPEDPRGKVADGSDNCPVCAAELHPVAHRVALGGVLNRWRS